ncbi:MAG: PAS domain S-box protein [Chthoniobacteraceae bacterium]
MNGPDAPQPRDPSAAPGLDLMARVSPVGIFRSDHTGAQTYVNDRWCEVTGLSHDEGMGSGWHRCLHPEDKERVGRAWMDASRGQRPYRVEARVVLRDGTVRWVQADAVPELDGQGKTVGWVGSVTDVTELQNTRNDLARAIAELAAAHEGLEQRVVERTQQLREIALVVEVMDDAVVWSDVAGRIVGWNQAAELLFGYRRSDVVGGSLLAITPVEEQGSAIEIERRVRLGEPVHQREVTRMARDGRRIPVLLSVFPLRSEAGSILGSATILRDLREQKKAEGRLRQLSQRLLGAQDEERRRIARELHDSTAQLLVALSINLNRVCMEDSKLSVEKRAELLAESCLLAECATVEVRTQSYLLHPPLLEERGLVAALRFFIDGFVDRSGIAVDFLAPERLARLDSLQELTLFRIVQESLGNVHRHSQSERAEIALGAGAGWIELAVRDFGCGLPADPGELRGVGIAGMRERVAQLGGALDLESAEPGVKVRVRLPLIPAP